jgi:hypothetical protein
MGKIKIVYAVLANGAVLRLIKLADELNSVVSLIACARYDLS